MSPCGSSTRNCSAVRSRWDNVCRRPNTGHLEVLHRRRWMFLAFFLAQPPAKSWCSSPEGQGKPDTWAWLVADCFPYRPKDKVGREGMMTTVYTMKHTSRSWALCCVLFTISSLNPHTSLWGRDSSSPFYKQGTVGLSNLPKIPVLVQGEARIQSKLSESRSCAPNTCHTLLPGLGARQT